MKFPRCLLFLVALFFPLGLALSQQAPPASKTTQPAAKTPSEQGKQPPRKRVIPNLSGFDLLASTKQPMIVGATRAIRQPVLLAPQLGKLFRLDPAFSWSYSGKARDFSFILLDDTQAEIFRTAASGFEFRLPAGAPQLQSGKTYFWTVEVSFALTGTSQAAPVGFMVVSAAQRDEIEKALAQIAPADAYQAGLARARVFTRFRLWYDSITSYSDLIARFPDHAELFRERGFVYAQLAATKALANDDFARADALQIRK